MKGAVLPAIRLYDLNHTVAPLLLAANVNAEVVSERLGNKDITITLKHCAHALRSMPERAVEAIEGLFGDSPTNVPQ